ncbi:MAG: biopolymer transporter ExbD [Gemmataceae bacterium]
MLRHRRRRGRHSSNDYVEPDLPITPMLDMSFQLLAFFVTTYNPGPVEAMLPLSLPKLDGGPAQMLSLPTENEAEEINVQISSTESGAIDSIAVFTKSTAANPIQLGNDSRALFEHLKKQFAALNGTPPGKLNLEIADELNYQNTIKVIDESRRAGYDRVSPTPLNKREKK